MNSSNASSSQSSGPASQGFGFRAKRFGIRAGIFVLLIAVATVAFLMFASYGDGYRVGTVAKMSRKGVLFKTWEGELNQGYLDQSPDAGGVATRIWYFTVDNDQHVLDQIDHAIQQNKKVKLSYKEKYRILPWVGDTRQLVFKVEEVQ